MSTIQRSTTAITIGLSVALLLTILAGSGFVTGNQGPLGTNPPGSSQATVSRDISREAGTLSTVPSSSGVPDWIESNITLGPPGGYPTDALFVNQTDEVYSAVHPSYLVVTSAATGGVVARFNLGYEVSQLAYDNFTHEVLASGPSSIDLFAIDPFDHQLVGTFPLPNPADAMSFDSANGRLLLLVQQINNEGNGTFWVGGNILELDGTNPGYPLLTNLKNVVDFGMFPGWFAGSMTIDTVRQVVYLTGTAGFSGYAGIQWFELALPTVGGTETGGGGVSTFNPQTDTVYIVGGPPAYCPCTWPDEISVISGATHNVTSVITPNNETWIVSMAMDQPAQRLYELDSAGVIYAVATANNTVVAHYPLITTCGAGISADTQTGGVYIPDECGDELQILSPEAGQLSQVIVGGGGPAGVAYDSRTGNLVVANSLANNVTVVSTESQRIVATVDGIPEATAVLYDPVTSEVYVVGQEGTVAILNDRNWTIIDEFTLPNQTIPQGEGYVAAAYDPVTAQVYVSASNSFSGAGTIYLISGTTHEITATVAVGGSNDYDVDSLTFDPINGAVWFGTASGYVGWVNYPALTITSAPGIGPSDSVLSLAFDGATATVYAGVESYNYSQSTIGGSILGLNATVGWSTSATEVGKYPYALAWSAQTQEILSANFVNSNVSLVNDSTNRVVDTLPVGLGPDALACDNVTGSVYVANLWSNNVSVLIPGPYDVTFTETGLPLGTYWSVTLNGRTLNSSTSAITFPEPNGTFAYSIGSVIGYAATPSSGYVAVRGAAPSPCTVWFGPTSGAGIPDWDSMVIVIVIAAIVVGVVAIVVQQGRRRPPSAASPPPPPPGQ
jgi:DNA-binding beta-propeller fold protein YncE